MERKLSTNQIKMLTKISELNREVTRKDLNEHLDLSSATFHYAVVALEMLGLVEVKQSKGAGNSHLINITQRGIKLI